MNTNIYKDARQQPSFHRCALHSDCCQLNDFGVLLVLLACFNTILTLRETVISAQCLQKLMISWKDTAVKTLCLATFHQMSSLNLSIARLPRKKKYFFQQFATSWSLVIHLLY